MRILKTAIVVMGIMIVALFCVLVYSLYGKATRLHKTVRSSASLAQEKKAWVEMIVLEEEEGATLEAVSLDGSRLAVTIRAPEGSGKSDRLKILDLESGETLSAVSLSAGEKGERK